MIRSLKPLQSAKPPPPSFASPSSSPRRLCPFMAKLQSRMFLNCTDSCLTCAPFSYGDRLGKCYHFLKLRKFSGAGGNGNLKVGRKFRNFSSSLGEASSRFSSAVRLGNGVYNYSSVPVSLDNAIRYCSSHSYGAFSRRFFLKSSIVLSKNDNVGINMGNSSGNSTLSLKHDKFCGQAKALTATNMAISSDQVVKAAKKDVKPAVSDISKESKAKKTSKKAAVGSKAVSRVGTAIVAKTSWSKQASKNYSTRSTPEEVPNDSANGSLLTQKPQEKGKIQSSKTKKAKSDKYSDKLDEQKPQVIGNTGPWKQRPLKPLYPPSGKSVVVVESLTKAKVIQGYLGDKFEVLPSHGHIRDLASKSGSVQTDDNFSMVWEVPTSSWTHFKSIEVALRRAENLILASDPDREGEAIAWHIFEMLQKQNVLREDVTVARVVFHEITEAAIKKALMAPREIDADLVNAYLARRALDYLIGYNISPLLWRKLPGCRSAGRVQSAALSLICDREMEIDAFKPQEYWTVDVEFRRKELSSSIYPSVFPSRLTHFDSGKLNQFSICSHAEAVNVGEKIKSAKFRVVNSKTSQVRKNPPAPYITSTLQQDAANKLQFRASYTMQLAQKLYEGVQLPGGKVAGLITYLRTDGLHISDEAVKDIRYLVTERYGLHFAAGGVQKHFKKVKNAQEAHEAIRPTDIRRLPSMLKGILDKDSMRLYTLIWARTVACQMEPTIFDQIQVDVGNTANSITFRSSCSKVGFLGYQAVYEDMEAEAIKYKENDDNDHVEDFDILNSLKLEDPIQVSTVELKGHKTQPPPRYSEGSLVKMLEELGIGRPSTYASTLKVLQDRKYVTVKSRVLHPEFRGRMVSAYLSHNFSEVSDYSFTADMEAELDNISAGLTEWKGLLRDYWTRFSSYCARAYDVPFHQVEKMLENKFGELVFSSPNRECPSCTQGTLIFKLSKHGDDGFFIGCDQHPNCKYTTNRDEETAGVVLDEPKLLGCKTNSNEKVFLKKGPYGIYVQLGENRKGFTPKRASVPQGMDASKITLEDALELMSYPKTFGSHPTDGKPIFIKISKNGFSLKHLRNIAHIPKELNPNDLNLEMVMQLFADKEAKRARGKKTRK